MPANYAHYRFGKEALPSLPAGARQCIQRFRRMYDMGLHGPDIFFYHNPFWKDSIVELGVQFHLNKGTDFFARACKAAGSEAARAYLYGLLGHYCLDSACHPYVNRLVEIGEAKHVLLESAYERYLLVLDKEPSPHTFEISKRLKLTRGECMTVAEFYPGVTGANVSQSVKFMAFANKFLASPRRQQREALLQKIKPELCDHMIPVEEPEELALYLSELHQLYAQALEEYPRRLEQLLQHIQTGEPLGEDFAPDFG